MIVMDQHTAAALAKLIKEVEEWEGLDERDLDDNEIMLIRAFAALVQP